MKGEDVLGKEINFSVANTFISEASHQVLNRSALEYGDVLITIAGTIGRIGFIAERARIANCNQAVAFARPDLAKLDPEWLCYLLRSSTYQAMFAAFVAGGAIPNVNLQQIRSLEIPSIDIEEQRQIAALLKAELAEVETARQAAQVQDKETEALIAAVYQECFKGIVPVAEPKAVEAAPSGWTWRRLTDLARLESGHTPSRSRPEWWGGDISWVSLTEIRSLDGQWVVSTQIRTNEAGISNSSARLLPRGTVCFSRTASVGFVTILATPMATSQDFANWVCGDDLDPEYLMYALIRSRAELRAIATGATHKTIYMPALESFQLCAPPRSEQERIVSALREKLKCFEQIRTALKQQQSDFKLLPQKIIAQAFES